MISESQFNDLGSRVALIEADNAYGSTFRTFDEGSGQTFIPESNSSSRPSSFDIKRTKDEKVTIRGGVVRQGGRGKVIVPDTDITPGGSSGAPNYALLEISASSTLTATIVCMATDAEDTGSNFYVTLWEVYQADGKAKVLKDRRSDILLRSPI
jgi:hypothetical protein